MKFNSLYSFLFISIFTVIGNLSYASAELYNLNSKNPEELIDTEYLKKVPSNDYILDNGDELTISVSRDYPELNSKISIDGEGTIYLPRLKRIYVAGLTINELNSLLNKAYLEFVNYPSVEVIVSKYRAIRVLIEGEVENPGLHSIDGSISFENSSNLNYDFNTNNINTNNINTNNFNTTYSNLGNASKSTYFPTVFDAIRKSGGITPYSDLSKINITRRNSISKGGGKIQTTLNFEKVLQEGDSTKNIRIYDSDVISVPSLDDIDNLNLRKAVLSNLNPKFVNVLVDGRVNRPGAKRLSKASVVSDAVALAGGAKVLRGPVTFIRFKSDGSIDKRKFSLTSKRRGSFKNPTLKEGDLIFVGQNFLTVTNEVIGEVTAPFRGLFSTYGLIKAINDD